MIDFDFEQPVAVVPSVRITVVGVGGAGGNTVNAMVKEQLGNVDFIAVNTDAQALCASKAPMKVQIGFKTAKGLGAGANPAIGKRAAEEDLSKIMELLEKSDVVFLVGGLGGGTASGALPVIANALKQQNVLTIAVVTKPFSFEGKKRMQAAQEAELLLHKEVDTLITIPNEKLLGCTDKKMSLIESFGIINTVSMQFVKSIADIIGKAGHINVDFADVKTIMKGMGSAVMGTGIASGDNRAEVAARGAIESPLLDAMSIKGARSVLINVTGGSSLSLLEVSQAASLITSQAHEDASVIVGSVIDDSMTDAMSVTVIATGFAQTKAESKIESKAESKTVEYTLISPAQKPVQEVSLGALKDRTVVRQVTPAPAEVVTEKQEVRQDDLEIPTLLRKMVQEKQSQQKN